MPPTQRLIVHKTAGRRHGPITRLFSPGDLGQFLKPFVFLDYIEAEDNGPKFGFHPHSGIATLSFPLTYEMEHHTSQGQVDLVEPRGEEWVVAGGGIWHKSQLRGQGHLTGFQTWFALPASHELTAPGAVFLPAAKVPKVGPVTVLLGHNDGAQSPVSAPFDANYLWVELKVGEHWHYQPPPAHDLAWAFAQSGSLQVSGETLAREVAVFAPGQQALDFQALSDCAFLVGSAKRYTHELALGHYSVHTSPTTLAQGEARIAEMGRALKIQ